jgi:hypothetical protein
MRAVRIMGYLPLRLERGEAAMAVREQQQQAGLGEEVVRFRTRTLTLNHSERCGL